MLRIALSTVRARRASFAGAFVAVTLAVALVSATGQLMAAALAHPGPGRYAEAAGVVTAHATVRMGHGEDAEQLAVRPAPRLPATAVARVQAAVGTAATAVGDLAFPVTVGTQGATGHGWQSARLAPFTLRHGHAPRGPSEVVADARLRLAPGARVEVVTASGTRRSRVVGTVRGPAAVERGHAPALFFDDRQAAPLAGTPGQVNAVALLARPGVDAAAVVARARAALGPDDDVHDRAHAADADAGDPRGDQLETMVAVMGTFGGLAAFVATFVVAGTFGLAIVQRRREIALVRAIGATPGQTRRMVCAEALVIALAASVVGLAIGVPLLDVLATQLRDAGVAPADMQVTPNWIPVVAAVASGVVIAECAVLLAARRAAKVRPSEALLEAAVEQRTLPLWRGLIGLVALGGSIALSVLALGGSGDAALAFAVTGSMLWALTLALLAPIALALPVALLGRPLARLAGAPGWLASAALATNRRRVGAVAAPIMLVVALAGTQALLDATARTATKDATSARTRATAVLVSGSGGVLPAGTRARVDRWPGVRAATGILPTDVYLLDPHMDNEQEADDAVGIDAPSRRTLDLGVRAGSLASVAGDVVAISDRVARRGGGVHVGDVLHARLADLTPATLRVGAIYDHALGLADIVLAHDVAARHAAVPADTSVLIDAPGHALAGRTIPGAHLLRRDAYLAQVKTQDEDNAWASWLIIGTCALFAAIAVINTIVMATAERRRELALLRLLGATRRQARSVVRWETLVTTLVAVVAGAGVARLSVLGIRGAYPGTALTVPVLLAGAIVGAAALLALVSAAVCARVALRAPEVEAAAARE